MSPRICNQCLAKAWNRQLTGTREHVANTTVYHGFACLLFVCLFFQAHLFALAPARQWSYNDTDVSCLDWITHRFSRF